ncbi:MAG TPA: four helix bundle protein [Longimicrobiales bacterium]
MSRPGCGFGKGLIHPVPWRGRRWVPIRSYRDLAVWQRARDMVVECHRLAERFPKHELYGLALQLRRAAVSVPANIAEGQGRRRRREFARFLSIAYDSLAEVETHVQLAERLGYVESARIHSLLEQTAEIGRMLNGLRSTLASREKKS